MKGFLLVILLRITLAQQTVDLEQNPSSFDAADNSRALQTAKCEIEFPTSAVDAVGISFFRNPKGGTPGADCPVACNDGTIGRRVFYAVKQQYDVCLQFNSGQNSVLAGSCSKFGKGYCRSDGNPTDCAFTYNEWNVSSRC
jgi:hypothetical protein